MARNHSRAKERPATKDRPVVKKRPAANARVEPDEIIRAALSATREEGEDPASIAKLANAYGALGLQIRSLELLNSIPEQNKTNGTWLGLAFASARLGDTGSCDDYLARIDPKLLTEEQRTRFHRLKCRRLEERGNFEEVLAYIAAIGAETLPIQLEIVRLDALAALHRHGEASACYLKKLADLALIPDFAAAAADHFHNRNDQHQALAIATDACRKWPRNEKLRVALCRAYWSIGDLPAFVQTVREGLEAPTLIGSSFANHVVRASKIDPSIGPLIDAALTNLLEKTSRRVRYTALDRAFAAHTLGRYEIAHEVARRYVEGGGIAPMARVIVAMCRVVEGEYSAAFAEIKEVMKQAPQLDAAYHPLFVSAAESEATLNEIFPLIEARRGRVARYRKVDSFGRNLVQNPELIQLHYMNGDFEKGLREKVGRRALSCLTYLVPKARPAVPDFDLPGGKSLFLIGDDGVSDEVRWSQYYHEMTRRFDRVEATCEPRLHAILERSFPKIRFHPVPRLWPDLPKQFSDLREDVPDWELARYLDGGALGKLRSFERVVYTNELVLSSVLERGTLTPVAGDGGYLKPDPLLKQQWAAKIADIAGDKKRVGVLWRSGLVNRKRNRFYFEGETLRPLLELSDCALFSLQHTATPEEVTWCTDNGIHILDVDLFNDFEAIAAVTSELNLVIGPSTLPLEMAAAVGTPSIIPGINLNTVGVRLIKGDNARCRMTKNAYLACDPLGYGDPDADMRDRLARIMTLVAEEVSSGRYGSGLGGY